MQFHQYQSEEEALKQEALGQLKGFEEKLLTDFIQIGPEALRQRLGIRSDYVWSVIFDALVFDQDVVKRCIMMFLPFFKNFILEKGPQALRDVFGIQALRYDSVYERIFDDVVVAQGLLFEYIYEHSDRFLESIQQGKGTQIRAQLTLSQPKYDRLWADVVDFLLDAMSHQKLRQKQADQSKQLLSLLQRLLSE